MLEARPGPMPRGLLIATICREGGHTAAVAAAVQPPSAQAPLRELAA